MSVFFVMKYLAMKNTLLFAQQLFILCINRLLLFWENNSFCMNKIGQKNYVFWDFSLEYFFAFEI